MNKRPKKKTHAQTHTQTSNNLPLYLTNFVFLMYEYRINQLIN